MLCVRIAIGCMQILDVQLDIDAFDNEIASIQIFALLYFGQAQVGGDSFQRDQRFGSKRNGVGQHQTDGHANVIHQTERQKHHFGIQKLLVAEYPTTQNHEDDDFGGNIEQADVDRS